MKSFEIRGAWWLPDSPQHEVPGSLQFSSATGGILELQGVLSPGMSHYTMAKHDVILGRTTSSQAVTLYQCRRIGSQVPVRPTDTPVARYQVLTVFRGCHFANESQMRFKSLSVGFRNLEEWTNITGLGPSDAALRRNDNPVAFGFKYVQPKKVVAQTEDVRVEIDFLVSVHDGRHEVRMSESCAFTIIPNKPLLFHEFMRGPIYNVQNFVCLGMGAATSVTSLGGEPAFAGGSSLEDKDEPDAVEIAYVARTPSAGADEDVSSATMLFTLRDIAGEFGSHMSSWLSKAELLQPVYDLYFGVYYNPTLYVNLQFLSYAQALETYHRRAIGGKYVSDEECASVSRRLADAIPIELEPDFRVSIRARLQYLHEYSLRKRLTDLFVRFMPVAGVQLPNAPNLIMDIVSVRNYLTHYEQGARPVADARRTFDLAGLMKLLTEAILLSELGFTPAMVARAINPGWRYVNMLGRLSRPAR